MKFSLTCLFILLSILKLVCQNNTTRQIIEKDFYLEYPTNWSFDKSKATEGVFIFSTELDSPLDIFRDNVTLMIQDLPSNIRSLNDYVELSLNQFRREDYVLLESNTKTNEKNEIIGHEFIYESVYNQREVKFYQFVMMKNGKAYLFTYLAELRSYDIYFKAARELISSFQLGFPRVVDEEQSNVHLDLVHKLTMQRLEGFTDLGVDGNYIIQMGDFSDDSSSSYSVIPLMMHSQ